MPVLEGALAPDSSLLEVEHLHKGDILAPEAFVIGQDGTMYSGLWDGRVVAFDANGDNYTNVFFTGGFVAAAGKAVGSKNGLDYSSALLEKCHKLARTMEISVIEEFACGRPLGLRLWGKKLYVLDAYHGLFELDLVAGGHTTHLMDTTTTIPIPLTEPTGGAAPEVSMPLLFLNDLDITQDGVVYMTDSSWKHKRSNNLAEVVDGSPRGRLLSFNLNTAEVHTLMCGLHFPNGVEVDETGTKLLLVESLRFRILEVDLAALSSEALTQSLSFCGERSENVNETDNMIQHFPAGVRVFANALPGARFVDNLVFDKELGGYLAGLGAKVTKPFSLLYILLTMNPIVRLGLSKIISLQAFTKLAPRYGLVILLGLDGSIRKSYHDPTGRTHYLSSAVRHPGSGYLFLGSSRNPYLGRVRL
ncbi:unnamed protein product [Discosporangium mesarthrocarpum]